MTRRPRSWSQGRKETWCALVELARERGFYEAHACKLLTSLFAARHRKVGLWFVLLDAVLLHAWARSSARLAHTKPISDHSQRSFRAGAMFAKVDSPGRRLRCHFWTLISTPRPLGGPARWSIHAQLQPRLTTNIEWVAERCFRISAAC